MIWVQATLDEVDLFIYFRLEVEIFPWFCERTDCAFHLAWDDRLLANVSLSGTIPAGIGNLSNLVTL
jgi:hypothetical protein